MVGDGIVRCVCRLRPNHCRSSQEEGPGEGQPIIWSCRWKGNQLYGFTLKRGSVAWILRFCLFWSSMWPATSQVCPASSWQASFQARLGDLFLQTSNDLFTVTCSNVFAAFSLKFFSSSAQSTNSFLLSTISTGLNALAAIALRLELFWQKGEKYLQWYLQIKMYLKDIWKHS